MLSDDLERIAAALPDRYRIIDTIGEGGMATVILAEDPSLGRQVAIKVLRPELELGEGTDRFLREIRIVAGFSHPNIVPLYDAGRVADRVYYTMPYLDGETLRERIHRHGPMDPEEVVRYGEQLAAALDYAHRRSVIHRDIKPENILLHEGQAMILDFGIALAAGNATRLTGMGHALGTPHYMSPKQASGEREVTPASDQFSLGCVLYEMLCGLPPFDGPTVQAVLTKRFTVPVRTLPGHLAVPEIIKHTVVRALAVDPADRFGSLAELAETLRTPDRGVTVRSRTATGFAPRTVVVLPFVNRGRGDEDEYLSDGITDELIHRLGTVPGLRWSRAPRRLPSRAAPRTCGRSVGNSTSMWWSRARSGAPGPGSG